MVTRPNSLDKEFKPINSTIRIDLRETNTAEKKEKSNIANASIRWVYYLYDKSHGICELSFGRSTFTNLLRFNCETNARLLVKMKKFAKIDEIISSLGG